MKTKPFLLWLVALSFFSSAACGFAAQRPPNILLILADDLGFSDIGCYGSEIATPNLDRLAAGGLRFTQFYNAARCCPTRAALLTGLYPHQTGVGHMLEDYHLPTYTNGLNDKCVTIAQLLHEAGYSTYHVGKWHVGGFGKNQTNNYPLNRGYDHFYGTGGGGNYFAPKPLMRDHEAVKPGDDYYLTDALSENAAEYIHEHAKNTPDKPFFLHLCYTAPHFPLQAKPEDIAKYRGKYQAGWDELRKRRFAKQTELGILSPSWQLSPRDPVAKAWTDEKDKDEWDLRMSVYAAMIDCMDQGIGRVLKAVKEAGAEENTLVIFLSDNGASAEYLDTWPNPARGNKPGSITGTKESHKCLEVGWANAGNTPFRQFKMWVNEGGISTPLIAYWPAGIKFHGALTREVGHVIDLMPTLLELAGAKYPGSFQGHELLPLEGMSLLPVLEGKSLGERTLAWEHEGNRAIRQGNWKLVATFRGDWELYDMAADRSELINLAGSMPDKVKALSTLWSQWANRVGVVPWEKLPGASYKPTSGYRKKSEPVLPD